MQAKAEEALDSQGVLERLPSHSGHAEPAEIAARGGPRADSAHAAASPATGPQESSNVGRAFTQRSRLPHTMEDAVGQPWCALSQHRPSETPQNTTQG
jgi:hypothetical protein